MKTQWNAVILAGDRGLTDPVALAGGVESKAFAKLGNATLFERIISVLTQCESIYKIFSVGPNQKYLSNYSSIQSYVEQHRVQLLEPASGPSASAIQGVLQSNYFPTLVVTCDLALLNSKILDHYCMALSNNDADFVATSIDYQKIHTMIPELKKTQYKFEKQTVCFSNVFALLSPQGIKALEYWRDVEKSRKKPIELIRKIDWLSLLNYKLGRLSLDQVAAKLSVKVGANLNIVSMNDAELAIDVDSAEDYKIIQKYLSK